MDNWRHSYSILTVNEGLKTEAKIKVVLNPGDFTSYQVS